VKFDDIQCTLSIFDLAGQERFREIQKVFYVGTNAVIYVFDFTRPDTLKNLDKWQNALYRGIEDEKEVISILIGNKVDLKDQLLVNRQDAEEKALALNCRRFLQTSALTGEHVDEAFSYISETLIHKANQLLARIR
jgi:small GTP-binding protein